MNYINAYTFFEDPERTWRELIKENKLNDQYSLFPDWEGLTFEKMYRYSFKRFIYV